jgi:glycosyltransferase involved in cell wall biosynthesis
MPRSSIADSADRTIYLNGKFCAQRTTGVQRVATELVRALDARRPGGRWVLLLHLWEQAVLPWVARDGWLVSLAGAAPACARRHVAMLHDAAVFDTPQAYRPAFVRWYRWLFRRLPGQAAALLTVSAFSRARLIAALGPAAERLAVLPNGADHLDAVMPDDAVLDRLGLRGRAYVLAVGSANPTKNLAALAQAHARLGGQAPVLVVAGGRSDRVFGAVDCPPNPALVQAGPVDDAALVALYRHAVLLVFPSAYEGFGLPPLEAMGQGCPVLAAPAPAVVEACGDAAAYLEGLDPPAIARSLHALLGDTQRLAMLREAGRRRATGYRWDRAADTLLAVLRDHGAVR